MACCIGETDRLHNRAIVLITHCSVVVYCNRSHPCRTALSIYLPVSLRVSIGFCALLEVPAVLGPPDRGER